MDTAIFPVAGRGTRLGDITKNSSKEMVRVGSKHLIDHAIDEALQAGISQLIFVINSEKKPDLVRHLLQLQEKLEQVSFEFVEQLEPKGLGHAIGLAKPVITGELATIILPDVLLDHQHHGLVKKMLSAAKENEQAIVAVMEIPITMASHYGIIEPGVKHNSLIEIKHIIEKPSQSSAPSNLAVFGRYIFNNRIFDYLEKTKPGKGNEIQLTDAIQLYLEENPVSALLFSGTYYDCGNREGLAKAQHEYGK